jgi:hypothetical protein
MSYARPLFSSGGGGGAIGSGATGSQGATGPAGGPQGEIGATGAQGDTGATGATGAQGYQGQTGAQGATGTSYWTLSGNNLYPTTISNIVGIRTITPAFTLDVSGNLGTTMDASINSITVGRGGGNVDTNTAIGFEALNSNIIGLENTAIGYQTLYNNVDGNGDIAVGHQALYNNVDGGNNIAIGYQTLFNTDSSYNVAVGYEAGITNTTGTNNTYIGYQTNCSLNNLTNSTAIGNGAIVDASNKIRLGNSSVTVIEGQVAFTNPSDARDKTNFVPLDAGLNFINELNPIRFDWNQRGGGLEGRKDIGFTAQELLLAQEKTKISIPNLVDESNPDKYHVMYTQLIPILVKSVQEMSSTITRLETEINELKSKLA